MIKSNLAQIAQKIGKNASEIAKETGINRNTINSLMKENLDDFRFSTIQKIADTYNLTVSDILGIDSNDLDKTKDGSVKLYRQEGSLVPFTCWPWAITVNKQAKEFFDFGFGEFKLVCKEVYGWAYWNHDLLYKLSKYVYEKYGKNNKIDEIYSVFVTHTKAIEHIYFEADQRNLLKLSDDSLIDYFNVLWKAYQKFWQYSVFIDSFDPGLDHEEIVRISNENNFSKEEVSILTTPNKMTFNNERIFTLLSLVEPLFKKKIPKEKLDSYIKDFVLNSEGVKQYKKRYDYYKSNYSTIRRIENLEVEDEIKKYLTNPELFKNEFNSLKNYTSIQDEVIKKVLKSHNLKSNPLSFFNLLTFWREERKKFNLMGIYVLDMILIAIEDRTGIPKSYLQYLSYEEVSSVIKGLITKTTLENRCKDGVVITLNENGYKIVEGKEAQSIHDELEKQLSGNTNESSFHGQTACQGYAKGIARIILEEKDFHKFQEGEILVTGMTRPEFVPLMKMAAGIVTNEGGITCHAAIVSRELGKPCIIGTKNATQRIKDGDLIEVRANHATVRILS